MTIHQFKKWIICLVVALLCLPNTVFAVSEDPILVTATVTATHIKLSPAIIPENVPFVIHVINKTGVPVELENSDTSVEIYSNMDRTFKVGLTAGNYVFFNDFNAQTQPASLIIKSKEGTIQQSSSVMSVQSEKTVANSMDMAGILFIVWRESVEALLVVGIAYSWLNSVKNEQRRSGLLFLWIGVVIGLCCAILLSFLLVTASHVLKPDFANLFQAGVTLIATAMIVYMVKWMRENSRKLKSSMHQAFQKNASSRWRNISILTVVAIAVAREASEASIFIYALGLGNAVYSPTKMICALAGGVLLAIATIFLLQLGNKIFSWRFFFKFTEVLLLLLGGGLLLSSLDKLILSGFLTPVHSKVWDTSFLLSDGGFFAPILSSFMGYRATPSLMIIMGYCFYWIIVYFLLKEKKIIFMRYDFAKFGNWLAKNQKLIWYAQWVIILFYILLMIIPVFLPLPDDSATLFHHFTVFAGFLFWGIWWPFVLISIILFGRLWCGVLCPEGALSEFANRYGRKRKISKWLRWGGWPFVAFSITTLYGQMISVYQYPKPVLLILGGSTLAAIIVGFLYGKSSRVWCKYLCPVTGVFNLLARLAPFKYQPLQDWDKNQIQQIKNVHCPTLLPLSRITGAANCLMCGKCAISKNAIQLTSRSPNEEIIVHGDKKNSYFDSLLIIFGLCGLALAAFQWTHSFWFEHFREVVDSWFLEHQITWVFNTNIPWWIFTHYPERGDIFSWAYGCEVIFYILGIGFSIGIVLTSLIIISVKITGLMTLTRFNHLSQSLIPLGGGSVFLGLFSNTIIILQKYANIGFFGLNKFKCGILIVVTVWGFLLAYKIIKNFTVSLFRRVLSLLIMIAAFFVINYFWILMMFIWSMKSDSIPWNTLWLY